MALEGRIVFGSGGKIRPSSEPQRGQSGMSGLVDGSVTAAVGVAGPDKRFSRKSYPQSHFTALSGLTSWQLGHSMASKKRNRLRGNRRSALWWFRFRLPSRHLRTILALSASAA